MQSPEHPLQGWIPYQLYFDGATPLVRWLYAGNTRFDAPFFDESIAICRSHAFNSSRYKVVSSVESLIEWASTIPAITPAAIIFHVSRCGSTLLSQLIGLDPQFATLSEVPLFDEILNMPYSAPQVSDSMRSDLLRAAISFTGAHRNGERSVMIKADSWHIFHHALLRELYPATPFIFLYRSPDEVVQSHRKLRGMQMVPNLIPPELMGFSADVDLITDLDAYTADVLEKYMNAFESIMNSDRQALLINYSQGVLPMIDAIGKHTGIEWSAAHRLQMLERSRFHSKKPAEGFHEDALQENDIAYLQKALLQYDRLEALRLRQPVRA